MKRLALIAAVAATLAAPAAFAQSATIISGNGPVIFEGPAFSKPINGAVIAEAPVLVAPGTVAVVPNTTILGAPAAVVTAPVVTSSTVVRHYWNVPANINSRMDFQRWQRLL
jgi:hypothetical protein